MMHSRRLWKVEMVVKACPCRWASPARRAAVLSTAGIALAGLVLAGCSGDGTDGLVPTSVIPGSVSAPPGGSNRGDHFDVPIARLDPELEAAFNDGDLLFSTPMRAADGLGPLYTRSACSSCHEDGVRGPAGVQKMSVVQADGVTPALDQSKLAYGHTVHPLPMGEGIVPPADQTDLKITMRLGPPVIGRGYIEAVADSEIERMAAEEAERDDGIHGRVNHVRYASEPNTDTRFGDYAKGQLVIGRFGLKARIPTLADFTADAFQGDMGITSPLRPEEFANPGGLTDDGKPGIDVGYDSVNLRAMYIRLLAIPARPADEAGAALFEASLCSGCHVPSLATRSDYPVPELAGIDAPIYSDLLLHRMGNDLADGMPAGPGTDGEADSFDWRTAPLIGLRFNRTYLHDGRAKSIEAAILLHRGPDSEANVALDQFEALSDPDRDALVAFVGAL
jgi:CxxC motif-containing protein (DUF1111 family)